MIHIAPRLAGCVVSLAGIATLPLTASADPITLHGARAVSLHRALHRAGVRGVDARSAHVASLTCERLGVGAGWVGRPHQSPPAPRYTCTGDASLRGASARALTTALGRAGIALDCAMGGRCLVAVRAVECVREGASMRCTLVSD